MNIFLSVQSSPVGADAVVAAVQAPATLNVFDLAVKGGWIMIPLFGMSIYAIYVFVERFFALRKALKEDSNFMDRIRDYIHDGKIESARNLCQSTDNPVSRMIDKGISRIGRPLSDVNAAIENVGNIEISRMEKGLAGLASVAGGAPMLGFLGTVIGMVQAFFEMANSGNQIAVDMLAGGIYTALVTTVGGLIVGIMAFFAYNYLVARIENVVFIMTARTMEFMDLLNEPAHK